MGDNSQAHVIPRRRTPISPGVASVSVQGEKLHFILYFLQEETETEKPQELFLRLFLRSALMSFHAFLRNFISKSINERYSFI